MTEDKELKRFKKNFKDEYNLYYPEDLDNEESYDLVMKILPEPVSRIYSGVKKFELRKYVPKHTGLMYLIETGRVNAITGAIYFQDYLVDYKDNLWEQVGEKATKKYKFDKYFSSKKIGVALKIIDFQKLNHPIKIEEIYSKFPHYPKLPFPFVYLYTPIQEELSKFLREKFSDIVKRNNL